MKSIKMMTILVFSAFAHLGFAEIIPNASYYIVEGYEKRFLPFDRPEKQPTYATFYSFQGDMVAKVSLEHMDLCGAYSDYKIDHSSLKQMLDSQAPKPQPVKYVIDFWPAFRIGNIGVKGVPGYFIAFLDKNGNCIWNSRYNEQTKQIMFCGENGGIQWYNIVELRCLDLQNITIA